MSSRNQPDIAEPGQSAATPRGERRKRSDGERTRRAILAEATALATVHGLDGLTIGRLAELTGMSKSGLFAHFGSKEGLQVAVVASAGRRAYLEYTGPGMAAESPLERLWGLCEYFLSFVERRVFPGGCFFTAVSGQLHAMPEPVRERIVRYARGWMELLTQCAREAIETGALQTELQPEQIAFELHALTVDANRLFIAQGDHVSLERAWAGVCRLLGDATRKRRTLIPESPGTLPDVT
jgi:AcrR family transcriptional regulator